MIHQLFPPKERATQILDIMSLYTASHDYEDKYEEVIKAEKYFQKQCALVVVAQMKLEYDDTIEYDKVSYWNQVETYINEY
jgi:hypothetical protein